MSKSPTIIINIYIYLIVKKTRVFGIENDQMTMTTLTTFRVRHLALSRLHKTKEVAGASPLPSLKMLT
jgi:hypothetical protein